MIHDHPIIEAMWPPHYGSPKLTLIIDMKVSLYHCISLSVVIICLCVCVGTSNLPPSSPPPQAANVTTGR